jgi:Protein of unknown function (DUF2000)
MSGQTTTHKFTLALNKRIDDEKALLTEVIRAALSVSTVAASEEREAMKFLNFVDGNGFEHRDISALSLIVMRGTSSELKKFSESARERRLRYINVTRAMLSNDPPAGAKPSDPEYIAVIAFGEKPGVEGATGRLSLWR